MPESRNHRPETFQAQFDRRWNHLTDPQVRDLAWLLDSPDLLDPDAPQWHGKIATLSNRMDQSVQDWLAELDRAPGALQAYLDHAGFNAGFPRLGRYAEKLLAFYFQQQGILFAHALQVRAAKNDTVGEFDFLLRRGDALLHWEFAAKLYLLEAGGPGREADYFVGPNLADTLGAKMRKILDRQLMLARHPAAQIHLPQAVAAAQALIKGWLFYRDRDPGPSDALGLSAGHCRGFWTTLTEFDSVPGESFVVLPRLRWLAPARLDADKGIDRPDLVRVLEQHFAHDSMPLLVALLETRGDSAIETSRGFIVPDDWCDRAAQRIARVAPAGAI